MFVGRDVVADGSVDRVRCVRPWVVRATDQAINSIHLSKWVLGYRAGRDKLTSLLAAVVAALLQLKRASVKLVA